MEHKNLRGENMGKSSKMSNGKLALGFGVLLVVSLLGMAFIFGGAQQPVTVTLPASVATGNIDTGMTLAGKNVCTGGASTSFDRDHYDRDAISTAFTDPELYRELGTTKWIAGTEGTAIVHPNIGVGLNYGFVSGISATDFVDEAYGPYNEYNNLPCGSRIDVESMDNEPETGLTTTFYNSDSNAAGQTVAANSAYKVSIKTYATSDNVFGNPYMDSYKAVGLGDIGSHRMDFPNVLALQLNVTAMDVPDYVKVTGTSGKLTFNSMTNSWEAGKQVLSAAEMNKIPCPERVSTEHGSSTSTNYCYEMPVIGDDEMQILIGINTDNSYVPYVDDTGYLYAAGLYLNDAGVLNWGVETDMGADVANDDADSVTIDITP